jgi:hypothetical protein
VQSTRALPIVKTNFLRTQTNQLQSPLLRLPAELRNIIYDFAFVNISVQSHHPHPPEWNWDFRCYLHSRVGCYWKEPGLLSTCRQVRFEASSAYYEFCAFDFPLYLLSDLETADTHGLLHWELLSSIEIVKMSGIEAGMWCHSMGIDRFMARIFPKLQLVQVAGEFDSEHGEYEDGTYGEKDIISALQDVFENKDLRICFEEDN